MQVQVDIGFDQLVKIVKKLPETQWTQLKHAVEHDNNKLENISDMEAFLLTAPTFSQDQLDEIAQTRKAINQWRTK